MILKELYEIIKERKTTPAQGSYTSYLFDKGTDKILKKIGEESAEIIIAAKGNDKQEQINEICDLTYHLLVLMAQLNIDINEVNEVLEQRRLKISNLKQIKNTDLNT